MEPRFNRQIVRGHVEKMNLYVAVLVGLVISCILQLVGLATPGWLIIKTGETTVDMGLWVIRVCVMDRCTSVSETDQTLGVSTGMLQYQAETCAAFAAIVFAIVLFCCLICEPCNRPDNIRSIMNASAALTLVSAILALTAAGKFGNEVRRVHDLLNAVGEGRIRNPYSLILTGFGGVLAGVMAVVLLCFARSWYSDNDNTLPPYSEMPAPGAAGLYSGQQHHHAHPSSFEMPAQIAAGVAQPGYVFQGQAAASYAGQPPYGRDTDLIL